MKAHPLSALLPEMGTRQFEALKADIAKNGMRAPIWTLDGQILDGRNRARACAELGRECEALEFKGDDPAAFVLSMNVHRRHLTQEQRRDAIAAYLKANPAQSDRAIAEKIGVDHKTVSAARSTLGGEIPHLKKRIGKNGVAQRATKNHDGGIRLNKAGRRLVLREGTMAVDQRAEQIRPLAESGMTVEQIALQIGIGPQRVADVMKQAGIRDKALAAMGKARRLDPLRLINESVTTLSAVADGIERIKSVELKLTKTDAISLFSELQRATTRINWLARVLRRAINETA